LLAIKENPVPKDVGRMSKEKGIGILTSSYFVTIVQANPLSFVQVEKFFAV